MSFNLVSDKLYHSGNDKIICAIDGSGWDLISLGDIADDPIFDGQRSFDHPIRQYKLRIGKAKVA